MRYSYWLIIFFLSVSCTERKKESNKDQIEVVKVLDSTIPFEISSEIEELADGFSWSEGPLWADELNALLFSDVPENKIYKWSESMGLEVYLNGSGSSVEAELQNERGSNGLALDSEGRLILAQHGNRQLARMKSSISQPVSEFDVLSDGFGGNRLNSPNDITVHSMGSIFFTDPPYGLYGQDQDALKELDYNGVYRVNGDTTFLLIDSLTRPNGLALSPDQRILYVANSDPEAAYWAQYELDENGNVLSGGIFYDQTQLVKDGAIGLPDGMKVHDSGYIFATGPGGVHVFHPSGELQAMIDPGAFVSNVAFDSNYQWLYMTVDDQLMRIQINPDKDLVH